MTSVVITADDELTAKGLRSHLSESGTIKVLAIEWTSSETKGTVHRFHPDVVLQWCDTAAEIDVNTIQTVCCTDSLLLVVLREITGRDIRALLNDGVHGIAQQSEFLDHAAEACTAIVEAGIYLSRAAYGRALLPRLARAGVRLVVTGGSRLDGADIIGTTEPITVLNAYGPTETTVTATTHRLSDATGRWPPIGRPIPGVGTYVLDERLAPVQPGTEGELYIAGSGLSWGYIGRPGRTATAFPPDPFAATPGQRMYATGDRVRVRGDGDLEFLGRMDTQVKVSGFRIEVGEVEHALQELPGVRDAAVVVREDVPGGAALVAFVSGDRTHDAVLEASLRERLPRYMMPKFYVRVDAMPLNRQGKVDWSALAEFPLHGGRA